MKFLVLFLSFFLWPYGEAAVREDSAETRTCTFQMLRESTSEGRGALAHYLTDGITLPNRSRVLSFEEEGTTISFSFEKERVEEREIFFVFTTRVGIKKARGVGCEQGKYFTTPLRVSLRKAEGGEWRGLYLPAYSLGWGSGKDYGLNDSDNSLFSNFCDLLDKEMHLSIHGPSPQLYTS